jgi:hypothetical protein
MYLFYILVLVSCFFFIILLRVFSSSEDIAQINNFLKILLIK